MKWFNKETQKWEHEGESPKTFPVRVRKKDCTTCQSKTPEEHLKQYGQSEISTATP